MAYSYSGDNPALQNLISAGLLDQGGNSWNPSVFDKSNPYTNQMGGAFGKWQGATPLSGDNLNNVTSTLNDYYKATDAWNNRINDLNSQYGWQNTQGYMDFLKSDPMYKQAQDAESKANGLRSMFDNATNTTRRGGGLDDASWRGIMGTGVNNPTVQSAPSLLGKIGGGLANTIGKNPWVVALPMLSAAAPALLGATGATAGTAGATAGASAGAAGAGSGGWFSSLLNGVSSIPSQVSGALGGGFWGDVGAGALKGSLIGGASSGLAGGNIGKGALMGGLTGGVTGGAGNLIQGTQLGDFLGVQPSVTNADNALLSNAQAGSGLPWSASGTSTLSSLGKALGLGGGGNSSMGTLATLFGGANNYFANKNALKQIKNAGNDAMALLNPYMQQGTAATSRLADLLGLSGNSGASGYGSLAKTFTPTDLAGDPGYQFQLGEGQKALDRASAARGGYYSGAALKDAAKYTQGLADTTYNEAFQRDLANKSSLYGLLSGQQGVGANAASGGADLLTSLGSAGANSTVGLANGLNSTLAKLLYGNSPVAWG